nr:ribonuclease H-like domain-containing protein [Tanacetum cinerariifolium]
MLNFDVTKKCLVPEGWSPVFAAQQIKDSLLQAKVGSKSQVGAVFQVLHTKEMPSTYFQTNKFAESFQTIVDAYGFQFIPHMIFLNAFSTPEDCSAGTSIAVPWMLLPRPFILKAQHNRTHQGQAYTPLEGTDESLQVLGAVSNTASYLHLWELSLAHSELSTVFYEKVLLLAWGIGCNFGPFMHNPPMGQMDKKFKIEENGMGQKPFKMPHQLPELFDAEESHRVAVGSIAGFSQRNQASAFVSNVPYSQNFQRNNQNFNTGPSRPNNVNNNRQDGGSGLNNNRPSRGSGLVCEICGLIGILLIDVLRSLDILLILEKKSCQNFKKQSVSNNNSVGKSLSYGFTDEQMAILISLIKDNKVGENAGQYDRKIIDSGANQYMSYTDKELDNVIDISHLKIKVGHPNRTKAYISKIENLRLSNGLTLYDVMVIPEYCVTLISVHKLIKKNKVIVVFDENRCYFMNQDLNLKNVLRINEQCEGLYYYNDKDPVLNVLKDSLNSDKKDNTSCCEICQRTKQTRELFLLSDHKSKNLGDLVHIDLWSLISSSESSSNINTADFPVDSGNDVDSSNDFVVTQNEEVPRQWNGKLTSTLIKNGFSQSKFDYCLYTKSDKGVFLALLVYVDDIMITGNSVYEIEKFKVSLKSKFMIKDLGKLKYFLGIEVVDTDKDYQKLMGKLIYLTNTRPDISYVVHCLSQFMHSSLTSHLKVAFKMLRHLKSCPGLGVHITKTSGMFLTPYSDAD